jgi:hypothetical protein
VAGTSGVGINLVGHHEILIPLIAAAVIEQESGIRNRESGAGKA